MRHSLLSSFLPGLCLLSIFAGSVPIAACAATTEQKTPEQAELDRPRLVIKNGSIFMVLDPDGTMTGGQSAPYGLYVNDTRYLSGLTFTVNDKPIAAISSQTKDGYKATFSYKANKVAIAREIIIDNASRNSSALVVERLILRCV